MSFFGLFVSFPSGGPAPKRIPEQGMRVHTGGKSGARRGGQDFARLAVVAVAYYLAGRVGLALPFTSGNISPVWPAAGVGLAAVLLGGYRVWPAITLGAFFVNFPTPIPHTAAIGITLGNTAGPLLGAWLLRRVAGFHTSLARLQDVLWLMLFGGLGGTAISATVGASVLFLTGVNAWSHFDLAWLMWWLGDAIGVLIVTPLVLTVPRLVTTRRDRLELASLLLGTTLICVLIFDSRVRATIGSDILVLGLVPFLLWGAIRFEVAGASAVTFLIATVAVWQTAHRLGPLIRMQPVRSATLLQSFLALIAISDLILAAVVLQRAQSAREQAAQEALQQSEKRLGGIVDTANEGIWMLDHQFRTRYVNPRMAELLGCGVDEMLSRPMLDFVFAEDLQQQQADLEQLRAGVRGQGERRFRRKDGSEFWATVATAPLLSPEGNFEGGVSWCSDLTHQRRSETERRSAVETVMLLSRAVEQTADSVLITDKTGAIIYTNPAFEEITGYSRDEALGKSPEILKSGVQGPDFYHKLWECITEGQPFRGTLINRKKNGELYCAQESITPIKDDAGKITHYVSVIKDITQLRKNQEQDVQLRMAREVQQRFYTTTMSVPGFDIAGDACPADETGGDYFDFIPMPDNSFYLAIGDVSGHGLSSALLMALTRAYVRSFAELQLEVGEILKRVNRLLRPDFGDDRYVAVTLVQVAPDRNSIIYANAGHLPGWLLDQHGEVTCLLSSTGPPLGLFGDCSLTAAEVALNPQDTLVLLTDGVTETFNSDEVTFGAERLLAYLRAHHRDSAAEMVRGLCSACRAFAGEQPQRDDITAIVMKRLL